MLESVLRCLNLSFALFLSNEPSLTCEGGELVIRRPRTFLF